MTLFGILWFIIMLWDFVKKPMTNTIFLTLLFMTFQSTNVLYLNESGIGPGILTSIVLIIKIFFRQKLKIRKIKQEPIVFITSVLLLTAIFISLVFNGILGANFMLFLQISVYVLCFVSIQFIKKDIPEDYTYQMIRKLIVFHAVFGVIQFLTSINVLPFRSILNMLFYNDTSTDVVFHRSFYSRVMSTFMEPSYAAGFLVGAFFFLALHQQRLKQNLWLLITLFVEIILTQSSTAYGAFAIVGFLLVVFSDQFTMKQKLIICGGSLLGLAILYFGFYSLLDAVIFSKNVTGSYRTRERFNNAAMEAFSKSPLFGVGYKNCRGSSIVYSLLGQMGIVGLVLYLVFNFLISFWESNKQKCSNVLLKASKIGVLSAAVCQIIACPDLDLCTYWVWLYVFSVSLHGLRKSIKKA